MGWPLIGRSISGLGAGVLASLAIEFLDEFVYGSLGAAWPLIRTDLDLSYVQIGLLLSAPAIAGHLIGPAIGILGDVWNRRLLILAGGAIFAASLALAAVSPGFLILLAALAVLYPASGAFVGLTQASYMDSDPGRREHNMARWTLAGEVGVVLGALVLALSVALGTGWRGLLLAIAGTAVVVLLVAYRMPVRSSGGVDSPEARPDLSQGVATAWRALRNRSILRWLVLLEFADLMINGLHGYIALYFVDVANASEAYAAAAVAVWTGAGLAGTVLVIPMLERVSGGHYLRASAVAAAVLFVCFLLAPAPWLKLAALAALGLAAAGWYSVIVAQIYASLPGWSGTVMSVQNVTALVGGLIPLGVGVAASRWGLGRAVWLLLAGPVVLLAGLGTAPGGPSGDEDSVPDWLGERP